MMQKLSLILLVLLTADVFSASAVYYPVTNVWPASIAITPGGTTVTVTETGGPGTGNTGTGCGVSPYQIGKNKADGYNYTFSPGVTHVRLQLVRIHDDDTVRIRVNGLDYTNFTNSLTPFAGNCSATSTGITAVAGGHITTTGTPTGVGSAIQVDIQGTSFTSITSLLVEHTRSAGNILASDVIYGLEIQNDTCKLKFEGSVISKLCAGKDVQLTATLNPNTTYTWSSSVVPAPVFSPSANVREPFINNLSPIHTGQYFVEGKRGVCTYRDTVDIAVSPAATIGNVKQVGPMCPGGDDTMYVPTVNLPTGGNVYAWGPTGVTKFDPNGYFIPFPKVQVASKGWYSVYAVDVIGCVSDTVDYFFDVLSGVVAGFNYTINEGCEADTVIFKNSSFDNKTQTWSFGDNSPVSTDADPTHYYIVPKPNNAARTYSVRLIIANGSCADTADQDIVLDHPLITDFSMDDDSICQGTTIAFTNNSLVKAGTTPTFIWNNGYGEDFQVFDLDHTNQYDNAGIYYPKLTLTDYLGCVGTYSLELVVDSTGGITFTTDKESICIGDEITFKGDYYPVGANSVNWDFNDGTTAAGPATVEHSYKEPGKYNITYSVDYRICPDLEFSREIAAKPYPNLYLGEDTAICPNGEPVFIGDIFNQNTPDVTYQWNTPGKDATKGIYVHHPGTYAVTADLNGCSVSDSIEVKKNCYINIPNAFTPNGDGNSDYFLPRQVLSRNITEFNMQVYNRWGQLMFQSAAVDGRGWDGKFKGEDQPTGVYVYTIQVTFGNGINEKYQGNVTLLR